MARFIKMFSVMVVVVLFSFIVQGQERSLGKESLKGLKGVHVVAESLNPDIEKDGLSRSSIQTDAELKLRMAGIKVLTEVEWLIEPGNPYLYVKVSNYKSETGLYALFIQVELKQSVYLERAPKISCPASTWYSNGCTGMVGAEKVNSIRDSVKDEVDKFINDYLAVNPKE